MKISATVNSSKDNHQVVLTTNDLSHRIEIPPKTTGNGSSANGGELLFLALATCYCNDIYREAARLNIEITGVEVEVEGEFGEVGEPARNVTYRASVTARVDETQIRELMRHTDRIAEIQNTLRMGVPVNLAEIKAISV